MGNPTSGVLGIVVLGSLRLILGVDREGASATRGPDIGHSS
jgi:hypothetical protein